MKKKRRGKFKNETKYNAASVHYSLQDSTKKKKVNGTIRIKRRMQLKKGHRVANVIVIYEEAAHD